MRDPDRQANLPWYKHFWPWVVFGLPAIAVVAGVTTVFIAQHKPDTLVLDNYYKEGLAINQELSRDRRAAELGLSAQCTYLDQRLRVQVSADEALPDSTLVVTLLHPTLADQDLNLTLNRVGNGAYEGFVPELASGNWHVNLEPQDRAWRLAGRWQLPQSSGFTLEPQ